MIQYKYSEEGYSEYKGTNRNCTNYHEFQGEKSKNDGDTIVKSVVADEGNPNMEENGTKSKIPPHLSPEKLYKLFSKLHISGIEEWGEEEQREAKDLITEYGSLFALHDMDMGRSSMARDQIKLMDKTPFKERHHKIPPISLKK